MNVNGNCFEIGTIQAFLDGETTPEVSLRLTDHIAACDACARLMAEADEENAIVFSTLERELNTLVPTQRLWSRINDSIEVEKANVPVWQKVLAFVRASLLSPSIAAAFGILLMLGIFAIWNLRTTPDVASGPTNPTPDSSRPTNVPNNKTGDTPQVGSTAIDPPVTISHLPQDKMNEIAQQASARAGQREIKAEKLVYRVPENTSSDDRYLAGEESYVKTIADLRPNVEAQKDSVMTPSSRVSYERDMAMVNDSIKRMRDVVKKNPRNTAARQVLYSSYQDKIDLMNSVAQREELMASLR